MRAVLLHDTLSGRPRPLEPRAPGHVGIYACGPTVYAPIHVGNARPFVVFALLKRFLEHEGYDVTLVENITDVNDKIYDAARRRGVPSAELAREMADRYREDTDGLELGRPDAEPLASESIPEIIDLIAVLIDRGHAYAAQGDVYFRVGSFPAYGKLSNRPREDMRQGEDDLERPGLKESPEDFALWKAHKPGEDTAWDAPWGRGRPGWHIECSAMAERALGIPFEVHGGGSDLVFPHHENEIAQTEAGRGRPLASVWMHNGMVRMGDEKMSKSLGNISLLHEVLERVGRDALVMYFVQGHYRQPLVFGEDALRAARRSVDRLRELCRRLDPEAEAPGIEEWAERFWAALADDFNTPRARAVLFEWVAEANRRLDAGERVGPGALRDMLWALGFERLLDEAGSLVRVIGQAQESDRALPVRPGDPTRSGRGKVADADGPPPAVEELLREREAARAARDYATADRKRDELTALGWTVRDTPQGPLLVPAG
jgi:cysteinyl-tRNA synthetase